MKTNTKYMNKSAQLPDPAIEASHDNYRAMSSSHMPLKRNKSLTKLPEKQETDGLEIISFIIIPSKERPRPQTAKNRGFSTEEIPRNIKNNLSKDRRKPPIPHTNKLLAIVKDKKGHPPKPRSAQPESRKKLISKRVTREDIGNIGNIGNIENIGNLEYASEGEHPNPQTQIVLPRISVLSKFKPHLLDPDYEYRPSSPQSDDSPIKHTSPIKLAAQGGHGKKDYDFTFQSFPFSNETIQKEAKGTSWNSSLKSEALLNPPRPPDISKEVSGIVPRKNEINLMKRERNKEEKSQIAEKQRINLDMRISGLEGFKLKEKEIIKTPKKEIIQSPEATPFPPKSALPEIPPNKPQKKSNKIGSLQMNTPTKESSGKYEGVYNDTTAKLWDLINQKHPKFMDLLSSPALSTSSTSTQKSVQAVDHTKAGMKVGLRKQILGEGGRTGGFRRMVMGDKEGLPNIAVNKMLGHISLEEETKETKEIKEIKESKESKNDRKDTFYISGTGVPHSTKQHSTHRHTEHHSPSAHTLTYFLGGQNIPDLEPPPRIHSNKYRDRGYSLQVPHRPHKGGFSSHKHNLSMSKYAQPNKEKEVQKMKEVLYSGINVSHKYIGKSLIKNRKFTH